MLKKSIVWAQLFVMIVLLTQVVRAGNLTFLECRSDPNDLNATATVNVTKYWDCFDMDPPSGFEISYSYHGPNSFGNLNEVGSKDSGTFVLTPEELDRVFAMDSMGNDIFQFSRKNSSFAFAFSFTAPQPGGNGYIRHKAGMPLSYALGLTCTRPIRQD